MLFPFLKSNTRIFRKMGYYKDQEGIMRRYIREADYWKSHLDNTKNFILKAAENKGKNKVAILGSGWLLDVPLTELASIFKEVRLFDIKHPSPIRQRLERFNNVKLIETDISGLAVSVFHLSENLKKSGTGLDFNLLHPSFDFNLYDFDLVVSCNILNQLDILLVDYLKTRHRLPQAEEQQLRRLVQETHLNLLPANKTCLISDVKEFWLDKQDHVIHEKSLIYTQLITEDQKNSWEWQFDNCFTYRPETKTWFKVIAVEI